MIDLRVGYLYVEANSYSVIQGMENVEFCTSAASNDSHVALSQHLPSFLYAI